MSISLKFDHEPCTRCGGGGRYGPNCVNAGRCFKCGGKGKQMTRKGRKAYARWLAWQTDTLSIRADSVVVGQRIRFRPSDRFVTILEVVPTGATGVTGRHLQNGVMVDSPVPMGLVYNARAEDLGCGVILPAGRTTRCITPDTLVIRQWTPEEFRAIAGALNGKGATIVEKDDPPAPKCTHGAPDGVLCLDCHPGAAAGVFDSPQEMLNATRPENPANA